MPNSLRFPFVVVRYLTLFAVAALLLQPFGGAEAQILELNSWPVDDTLASKKAEYFTAFKSGNVDADREALEKFFDNYYFARWTALEEVSDGQKVAATPPPSGSYVRDLLLDFRDTTGNAREYLLKKTFDTLQKMAAQKDLHPSARYNAVLAIGQLAQRESPNRNSPPVLYAPSLPYLITESQKDGNPDYVKLAALIGVVRHAKTGIADETMKNETVPNLLLAVIETGKPAQGVTKEVQELKDWSRMNAFEGLAGLKSVGADGKVVRALENVIGNPAETLDVRTRAARVLGDLDFAAAATAGTTLNFQQLGTMLVSLMKTTADTELQSVNQLRDKSRAATGQVSVAPGAVEVDPPFDSMMPEQQIEVEGVLQSVKSNVQNVVYGMRGSRFSGSTATQGVQSMLSGDDAVAVKINATMTRGVGPLIKKLDEGPPEDQKSAAVGMLSDSGSSDMPLGGGAPKTKPKDDKKIKVNLLDIRKALEEFSTELGGIVSGSET